ncbi:MAG: hypothetical protein M3R17_08570 [Bacteroidota bacterium]|nr:hypothetical protein [Bacteroidota bacterium]
MNIYGAYYPDIILLEIISRLESGLVNDELEKRIRYYIDYTKNKDYPVPPFHKKFDGFIALYNNSKSSEKRKDLCEKYSKKITPLKESFNPFHHIFFNWMKAK